MDEVDNGKEHASPAPLGWFTTTLFVPVAAALALVRRRYPDFVVGNVTRHLRRWHALAGRLISITAIGFATRCHLPARTGSNAEDRWPSISTCVLDARDPHWLVGAGVDPILARTMAEAAERTFDSISRRYELSNAGYTIHALETLHMWSLLWAEAAAVAAQDEPSQRKALGAHVVRMQAAERSFRERFECGESDINEFTLEEARYFVLDAERFASRMDQPPKQMSQPSEGHLRQMRDAAGEVCAGLRFRDDFEGVHWWIQEFPSAGLVERVDWSSRLMDAELTEANSAAERIAAKNAHLERLRHWEAVADHRLDYDVSPPTMATLRYYRLEAELGVLGVITESR
jgi:hypothetical protein